MKKIIINFITVIGYILNSYSQELTIPVQTQYLADNPFSISPTYAGIGDNVKIRVNGLSQWVGIKNAPNNQSLAADMRIASRSGVGLFVYNDRNGNTKQQGAKFSFAHHLILNQDTDRFLSFGISYNFNQFRININDFDSNDDLRAANSEVIINHNFDLSALYRVKNFYLNFNVVNILNKNIDLFTGVEPITLRNFQVYTGYVWKKERLSNFEIEPSIFFQFFQGDGRSSTDLNVKFRFLEFESYYWAGINYRFFNDQPFKSSNIGPMGGLKKSNFYFAYSYQITTNILINYNSGSHMITLGFDLFQGDSNCSCMKGLPQ